MRNIISSLHFCADIGVLITVPHFPIRQVSARRAIWLTAEIVALLFIPIMLLAHRAVDYIYRGKVDYSFSLVHGFVLANWISLGHYLFASPSEVLSRINFAIALQVGLATGLLIYTLWFQYQRAPESAMWSRRAWKKNVVMYAVLIGLLELGWPSNFDSWWMFWQV